MKMELSKDLLQELKCIQCAKYLACGPIYMQHTTGEAICGRCTVYENQPITRNKQYETIAKKILFPCEHASNGCTEKIHFSVEPNNLHEQTCKYRDRECPVSTECEWIGPWTTLVAHCRTMHPSNVLGNPNTLKLDVSTDALQAYVVTAFEVLFIMHVKVCVKEAKLFHSLRYLGNPKKASQFKYKLDIQRNEILLSKPGVVEHDEGLFETNSCLSLCVNGLLSFLEEFEGTTFTVTVQKSQPAPVPVSPFPVAPLPVAPAPLSPKLLQLLSPTNIDKFLNVTVNSNTISISECPRKNNGCHYTEIKKKMTMHERYYCNLISSCYLCKKQNITVGQIHQHYLDAHKAKTYAMGEQFRITYTNIALMLECCLISSPIGYLMCWYKLNEDYCDFHIVTPLPSNQLELYQFTITITNTKSNRNQAHPLLLSNEENSDFTFRIFRNNIPANRFDVAISFKTI